MNFAQAAEQLSRGQLASGRPAGHSMTGVIAHKQHVTLRPLRPGEPLVGQAVLVRLKGRWLLHRVGAAEGQGQARRYRIENARGHVNGWARAAQISGVVVGVGPEAPAPAGAAP